MRPWIQLIIRHRRYTIVAIAVVTLLLLSQLTGLKLVIDPDNILPRDHHFVKTNDFIEKTFGNKFTVVITVTPTSGDVFQSAFLTKVRDLTERLGKTPGLIESHFNGLATEQAKTIEYTENGPLPVKVLDEIPNTPESMEAFRKRLTTESLFQGLLISKDHRTTQIIAEYAKIDGGFEAIEKNVEAALADFRGPDVEIHVGGLPIFLAALERFSGRMGFLFPLALLIIGLIHYEAFRTYQALVLPLVTALLAVVWAVGILGLLRQSFDVFNAATPILILAIAAGHAVQILKRYYEEFYDLQKKHPEKSRSQLNLMAVEETLVRVGPVMIIACVVAALGFFSLIIFEIKTVRTFGLFTGFGVLSALVIELTFIPALRAMLPAPGEKEQLRQQRHTMWDSLTEKFFSFALNQRKKIYVISAVTVLIFAAGTLMVRVDNSQKAFFANFLEVKKNDAFINENMAGTNLIYLLIDGGDKESLRNPALLSGIEQLQNNLNQKPEVGKTISIVDFLKRLNQMMNRGSSESYSLPNSDQARNDIFEFMGSESKDANFSSWIDKTQSKTVIATFIKTDSSIFIEDLARNIKSIAQKILPPGVQVDIGGGAVNGVALNEVLIREKILNIAQILFAVFFVTALVFRSLKAGALIIVPLLAAVIVNFGIMGLLGIPLQIATALVSAMAVGIGADYGIYMSYRLREELRKGLPEPQALRNAYMSAGKATLFVSSAVAGGFGLLMLSWGFYIHIWMGFLIATAMLTSAVAALTLFPALIYDLRPKFIFEKN